MVKFNFSGDFIRLLWIFDLRKNSSSSITVNIFSADAIDDCSVENPKQPDKITGKIEFDHVWFAYDGENYVLKDVSFVINPGEKVAFVGATGAGKSSILNLIGRYYDIQKGHIYIDGGCLVHDQYARIVGKCPCEGQ